MTPLDGPSFTAAAAELASGDEHLAAIVTAHGIPDFWHRPPGFATLCLFIVEQQVSLASAKAVFDRLVQTLGEVAPERVIAANPEVLGRAGLTRQKQRYLRALATAVVDDGLDLGPLATTPDEEVRRQLLGIVGIGPWTADVYLLAALRRPDVWPVGDRALQVGVGEAMHLETVPGVDDLAAIGERWRPLRSVAARLIWHSYLRRRNRAETEVAGLTPLPEPTVGEH